MLHDSHCHLPADISTLNFDSVKSGLSSNKSISMALMSTNQFDIPLVADLAIDNVTPCFGIHPWYSHLFHHSSWSGSKLDHYKHVFNNSEVPDKFLVNLPEPTNLQHYLKEIEHRIISAQTKGNNVIIGEIGLDKLFRIPWAGFFGNSSFVDIENGKVVSPFKVTVEHQQMVFEAQLNLAAKHGLPVSVHCVKLHGLAFDLVRKFADNNKLSAVCLHSYSGSVDQAKRWLKFVKCKVYFSLSQVINGKLATFDPLVKILPDDSLLIETDFPITRYYQDKDSHHNDLYAVLKKISEVKNWNNKQAETVLDSNWQSLLSRNGLS